MCLWTRGAYRPEFSDKLLTIVQFVIQVYAVSWFEIKRDNYFYKQQQYISYMIQRINKQSTEIQNIALKIYSTMLLLCF